MKEGKKMNDIYDNGYFNFIPYEGLVQDNHDLCFGQKNCNLNRNNLSSSNSTYSSYQERVDSFFNPSEGFAKGNMQANTYKPYKLTNPPLPPVFNDRQRLILEVQKYNFAMWDLNLYLNTHPTDRNTMIIFNQYRDAYKKVKEEYENKYGALCVGNTDTSSGYWSWNKSPWPWEGECR